MEEYCIIQNLQVLLEADSCSSFQDQFKQKKQRDWVYYHFSSEPTDAADYFFIYIFSFLKPRMNAEKKFLASRFKNHGKNLFFLCIYICMYIEYTWTRGIGWNWDANYLITLFLGKNSFSFYGYEIVVGIYKCLSCSTRDVPVFCCLI